MSDQWVGNNDTGFYLDDDNDYDDIVADDNEVGDEILERLTDPNADLIGLELDTDHGVMKVLGSTLWNTQYVECVTLDGTFRSVKPAKLVRRGQ